MKKIFNMYCYCAINHEDEKNEKEEKIYCELPLWQESEEHVFKYNYSNGIYTIFLADHSYSMSDDSIRPHIKDLQNDNLIEAAIEEILNYGEERAGKNLNEKYALIGYESTANLVFEDVPIKDIATSKYNCISQLKPIEGVLYFYKFFKKLKL